NKPLIIIDEFHTFRTKEETMFDDEGIATDIKPRTNKHVYVQMRRLMQLTTGIKIGLSATLMPDKPIELVSVTSLFLPEDKQLSLDGFRSNFEGGTDELTKYLE
ncbi:unnamed protein product, partial [marine sediment metagenome]